MMFREHTEMAKHGRRHKHIADLKSVIGTSTGKGRKTADWMMQEHAGAQAKAGEGTPHQAKACSLCGEPIISQRHFLHY